MFSGRGRLVVFKYTLIKIVRIKQFEHLSYLLYISNFKTFNSSVGFQPSAVSPPSLAMTVTGILLVFSCISLIFLTATAFIFTHFR